MTAPGRVGARSTSEIRNPPGSRQPMTEEFGATIEKRKDGLRLTAPHGLHGADVHLPYPSVGATEQVDALKLAEDKLARAKANMLTQDYRDARMRAEQAELDARLAEAQVLNQKSEEQLQVLQSRVKRLRKQLEVQP